MANNSNLHAAKSAKNDEFYTQLNDVEKEMKHYKDFSVEWTMKNWKVHVCCHHLNSPLIPVLATSP